MPKLIICLFLFTIITSMTAVGATAQGEPEAGLVVEDRFGVEMIYLPPGSFQLGVTTEQLMLLCEAFEWNQSTCNDRLESYMDTDVLSTQDIHVEAFWIDKYEVTIEQFADYAARSPFVEGTVKNMADHYPNLFDNDQKPLLGMEWYLAMQYCNGRLARLPTEAEWEYAASGPHNFIFPWGNDFEGDIHDYVGLPGETHAVGSYSNNASWIGAFDMAGNAAEWVEDRFRPYDSETPAWSDAHDTDVDRVVRGGSWGDSVLLATTFARDSDNPSELIKWVGFRCARSSDPRED